MSKRTPFLFFIILIMLVPLPRAEALGIGPPSFELDLQIDGSNSTTFYITSDGLEGQLIVGMENLPFRVDPPRINMSSDDVSVPVELTFYGNETLEPGVYEGKVTLLAYTGGFVAVGIKIKAKITLLGEAPEIQEEEPEMSVASESEEEPEAETEQESEPEAETESESEEEPEIIAEDEESEIESEESESDEEPEPESQENSGNPYIIGGVAGAAIAACVAMIFVWWKRR